MAKTKPDKHIRGKDLQDLLKQVEDILTRLEALETYKDQQILEAIGKDKDWIYLKVHPINKEEQ